MLCPHLFCLTAMNVTAVTRDLKGTTVRWIFLSVTLIHASMVPHV